MDIMFWKKQKKEQNQDSNQDIEEKKNTYLGKNLNIKGNIKGDDSVQMMCAYKGEIDVRSEIEIGRSANVSGNVRANKITVGGRVKGKLRAEESLYVLNTAIIKGDMQTSTIIIDMGASFNGKIDMSNQDKEKK